MGYETVGLGIDPPLQGKICEKQIITAEFFELSEHDNKLLRAKIKLRYRPGGRAAGIVANERVISGRSGDGACKTV